MKLHKVFTDGEGAEAKWFSSHAAAVSYRFQNKLKGAEIDEVEVPTDKKGLIEWLNNNEK